MDAAVITGVIAVPLEEAGVMDEVEEASLTIANDRSRLLP